MTKNRRLAGVIALSVVALVATGCASPGPVNTKSPAESQKQLFAVLDDVQQQIGGDWVNEDSLSPRGCELRGGDDGATFTGARTLAGAAMSDTEIDDLVAFLGDKGFDAGSAGMGVLIDVMAVDPDDKTSYVEVRIGKFSTQLTGQAPCAVGDVYDELQRVENGD